MKADTPHLPLSGKSVIACVHLLPTPGSPAYGGSVSDIYHTALQEAALFAACGVDALIVENFRDGPFFPAAVPPETLATIAGVTREVVGSVSIPVGVAVLRNDAVGALAIAECTGAQFIRVNVHVGAVLAEQGIVTGNAHETHRLRRNLGSSVAILADAHVKHSRPWAYPDLATEVRDLSGRAEGIVVSGELTGLATVPDDLDVASRATTKPIFVGSGVTPDNLDSVFPIADGFIVGSYFKSDGIAGKDVDRARVEKFMDRWNELKSADTVGAR
ncbi:BtpA/SgcQ family protein [Nocardia sp. NPDC088792]|uniref:BtpA/SgcQ family protein n=1 Tax=Nocardia sp. NPDC088792 TaxID=3364332 RepID=UPI00382FB7FB